MYRGCNLKDYLTMNDTILDNKTVLMAHQGRPEKDDYTTLEAHAMLASELLGKDVSYEDDIFGSCAKHSIKSLEHGEVLLLENIRFYAEETLDRTSEEHARSQLVRKLVPLFDLFINDAFSVSHRSHCFVTGFTEVLPSLSGILMDKEITALDRGLKGHEHPAVFYFVVRRETIALK
jgi:phosphoglycerate kinase